jgi:tetratricopeptide (TPR) repeat protein
MVLAVTAAGVAAVCCALPWLSHRQIDRAVAVWRSDPESAYDHLERARALNPLSAEPDLVAGAIAARLDDRSRMPALFARSLERNPHSWYAQLELGLAESISGRPQAAVAAVRRAIALNPQEPLLRQTLRRLEQGEQISPSSLDAVFLDRIASRTQ